MKTSEDKPQGLGTLPRRQSQGKLLKGGDAETKFEEEQEFPREECSRRGNWTV